LPDEKENGSQKTKEHLPAGIWMEVLFYCCYKRYLVFLGLC